MIDAAAVMLLYHQLLAKLYSSGQFCFGTTRLICALGTVVLWQFRLFSIRLLLLAILPFNLVTTLLNLIRLERGRPRECIQCLPAWTELA